MRRAPASDMRLALAWALVGLALVGCVPLQRMPLSAPSDASAGAVQARVSSVAASHDFVLQRGGGPFVLAVTGSARNDGEALAFLELDHATLTIADPGHALADVVVSARASGSGAAPEAIDLGARAAPLVMPRGENVAFWVAFRLEEPLAETDIPRRITLRVPLRDSPEALEVAVAEPSTGRPRWVHPPIRTASYAGTSLVGTPFDEGSLAILRSSAKSAYGRLVTGPTFSLGVRAGALRGERERTIDCCDLGLAYDFTLTVLRRREGSFGPMLTYQAVFALDSGRPDRAAWHGPGLGLQFFTSMLEPLAAGALPVRPTPTPLGYSSFTIAYVHLFRRGEAGGAPGMLLSFEHTLPEP